MPMTESQTGPLMAATAVYSNMLSCLQGITDAHHAAEEAAAAGRQEVAAVRQQCDAAQAEMDQIAREREQWRRQWDEEQQEITQERAHLADSLKVVFLSLAIVDLVGTAGGTCIARNKYLSGRFIQLLLCLSEFEAVGQLLGHTCVGRDAIWQILQRSEHGLMMALRCALPRWTSSVCFREPAVQGTAGQSG